jgi:hypothetical protein
MDPSDSPALRAPRWPNPVGLAMSGAYATSCHRTRSVAEQPAPELRGELKVPSVCANVKTLSACSAQTPDTHDWQRLRRWQGDRLYGRRAVFWLFHRSGVGSRVSMSLADARNGIGNP